MAGDNGYVTLMGAEQVQSAGVAMRDAAQTMVRAAGEVGYHFDKHQRYMDDWLQRFEYLIERMENVGKT